MGNAKIKYINLVYQAQLPVLRRQYSAVGILTGLQAGGYGVRIPTGAKHLSLLKRKTLTSIPHV
jgi:hypothetical protein